jgi:hypothetical protein
MIGIPASARGLATYSIINKYKAWGEITLKMELG